MGSPTSTGQFLSGASEAFKTLLENQRQKQQLAQQSEYQKAEIANRDKANDINEQMYKATAAKEQAQMKLAAAVHNAQLAEGLHRMQVDAVTKGVPIPGAQEEDRTYGGPDANIPIEQNFTQHMSIPNLRFLDENTGAPGAAATFDQPSPQKYALQQAQQEQTMLQPKTDAQIQVEHQKAIDETNRFLSQIGLQGQQAKDLEELRSNSAKDVEALRAASAKEVERMRATSAREVEGMRDVSSEKRARINQGLEPGEGGDQQKQRIQQDAKDLYDGKISVEQFNQQNKARGYNQLVNNALKDMQGNALTAKQIDFVKSVGPAVNIIPKMTEANNLWKQTPVTTMANPLSPQRQRLAQLQSEIEEGLTSATNLFAPGSRLSEPRIKRVVDAYGFSKLRSGAINDKGIDEFQNVLHDTIRTQLQGQNKEQQDTILARLHGMATVPYDVPVGGKMQRVYSSDGGKTYHDINGQTIMINVGGKQ